jgi:hypothetical protein
MAVEVADIDGNGYFDLMVPDMRYSCFYLNTGQGYFEERSVASGIAAFCGQYVSWGSVIADFDLDGNLDLYISNGDAHHLESDEDLLFRGDGTGQFENISESAGEWAHNKFVSRGIAGGDFDNDGDVDLLVASLNDRPVLLRNDSPRDGKHWLGIQLVNKSGNLDAIGSVVKVNAGPLSMKRQRMSGGSYLSQHDHRLFFGLDKRQKVDTLEVTWPDGSLQVMHDLPVDTLLTITQEVDHSTKP